MKLALEDEFQAAIITLAEACAWRIYHVSNVKRRLRSRTSIGFPDLVLARVPIVLYRECKVPPNKLTADQEEWLALLTACGEDAKMWTPDDWQEIEETLAWR